MKIKFVPQPFANQPNLADFIDAVTASNSPYKEFHMVVAWAKRSGLARIAPQLTAFQQRHRPDQSLHAIVGVSEGGATAQGLGLLISLMDTAYVFHDAGRTFHPKIYIATGNDEASIFIGSNNMTAGGLAWNYEAALWIELDRSLPEDEQLWASVMDYYKALVADTAVCVPLNTASLAGMINSPLQIQDEDAGRRPSSTNGTEPEDDDGGGLAIIPGLFKRSATKKRPLPKLPVSPSTLGKSTSASVSGGGTPVPPPPGAAGTASVHPMLPPAAVSRRWFKTLDPTAAQQPPNPNTNPTGNLRLSQESFNIDHKHYFERTFFGGLPWTPRPNKPTVAEVAVAFDVYINGQSLGIKSLVVSHAPHRISAQGNVPTVLHWGPISKILRSGNYVDEVVTLERLVGGTYRLVIAPHATGHFMP